MLEVEELAEPLAEPGRVLAPGALGDGLVPALHVVHAGQHQPRQRRAQDEVIPLGRGVEHLLPHPRPLDAVDHATIVGVEVAGAARVDGDDPHPPPGRAEVAVEAEARRRGVLVDVPGPVVEVLGALLVRRQRAHLGEDGLGLELGRAEVAQVLVHPVRGVGADDPVVPPVLLGDPAPPRHRRVPVVAEVVVVEQHRRRDGRQEPPHRRLHPRLLVQPGVLLVVEDLAVDLLVDVATLLLVALVQPVDDLLGRVVGVHLVAEHEQRVGPPVGGLAAHPPGQRDQGVGTERLQRVVVERRRAAARPERQTERRVRVRGADDAGRERAVGERPDLLVVEEHLVLVGRGRLEALDRDERVVVAVDAPGAGAMALVTEPDLHLAGRVGLDPDGGPGLVRVAQHRSDSKWHGRAKYPDRFGGEPPPLGPRSRTVTASLLRRPALVAQGIEHRPPEPCAQVRILPRAPCDASPWSQPRRASSGDRPCGSGVRCRLLVTLPARPPLRADFHVRHRLDQYGAGVHMDCCGPPIRNTTPT